MNLLLVWSEVDRSPSYSQQALHAIGGLSPLDRVCRSGLLGATFRRLSTWVGTASLGGAVGPSRDADTAAGAVGDDPKGRSVGLLDDAAAGC
jgi:hypothetical protein